ncbi:MAG: glutamine synthetase III, partial [Maribacter sp.]|uniref:glutamine synthetase III n=1 Tax=Maribacter sp. TaxID=1897614 RepID=UPI003C78B8A0
MSGLRFNAILESQKRIPLPIEEKGRRSEFFATNVFNEDKMLQHLTKDALESVRGAIDSGSKIERKIADQVAEAMKGWAISKGATHYT